MDKTDTLITKSKINAVTGGQDFVAVDIATQPVLRQNVVHLQSE